MGIRAYLGVPHVREGRIVAYVAVDYAAPHAWTADEVALVEETSERTCAAIERACAEAQPGLRVVGEATTGEEAWERVCELRPDLLLLDLSMAGMDGTEAARVVRDCPEVRILVLTMHEDSELHRPPARRRGRGLPRQAHGAAGARARQPHRRRW